MLSAEIQGGRPTEVGIPVIKTEALKLLLESATGLL